MDDWNRKLNILISARLDLNVAEIFLKKEDPNVPEIPPLFFSREELNIEFLIHVGADTLHAFF